MHFLQPHLFDLVPLLLLVPLVLLAPAVVRLALVRQLQMKAWVCRRSDCSRRALRRRYRLKAAFLMLALLSALSALGRPAMFHRHMQYRAGMVDAMVLIDVSRSMAARDCNGKSRLATARKNLRDAVLPLVAGNRLGIITYAGEADQAVYLTEYLKPVYWFVENGLMIGNIGSAPGAQPNRARGSALGAAFGKAFSSFDEESSAGCRKILILYSDGGADDDTDIQEIAAGCRARHIRLFVVGLGQLAPAMIPVSELSLEDQRQAAGPFYSSGSKLETTAIDKNLLEGLSEAAGGTFCHINAGQDFHLSLPTSDIGLVEVVGQQELFQIPVFVFLVCLLAAWASTSSMAFGFSCKQTLRKEV